MTSSALPVRGVTLCRLTRIDESRGRLVAGEFARQIPFAPKRYFLVFDVPGQEVRGRHAHRQCHQFLVCLRGSVTVVVDDGAASASVTLDAPEAGLYIPPLVWGVQQAYSADALLLVFASDYYDDADYIRDYDEFRRLVGRA